MIPSEKEKYELAKKRVEAIKGFYIHLTIYLIVNSALLLIASGIFRGSIIDLHMPSWGNFTTPFFWGIGLFFHGMKVFGHSIGFLKKWEERKIKDYLEREEKDSDFFSNK